MPSSEQNVTNIVAENLSGQIGNISEELNESVTDFLKLLLHDDSLKLIGGSDVSEILQNILRKYGTNFEINPQETICSTVKAMASMLINVAISDSNLKALLLKVFQ